jgi:hypothetical protein
MQQGALKFYNEKEASHVTPAVTLSQLVAKVEDNQTLTPYEDKKLLEFLSLIPCQKDRVRPRRTIIL